MSNGTGCFNGIKEDPRAEPYSYGVLPELVGLGLLLGTEVFPIRNFAFIILTLGVFMFIENKQGCHMMDN